MDIHELIVKVADGLPVRKDFVAELINKITKEIVVTVTRGERVSIRGFGYFISRKQAARRRSHPKTGVVSLMPARTVVKFRPSTGFKASVAAKNAV